MRALAIGLGLVLVADVAFLVAGVVWKMPALVFVFGVLAVATGVSLSWLVLLPAIRKRWGAGGERVFQRTLAALAVAVVVLPLGYVYGRAAMAIGPDPAFIAVSLFVVAVVALVGVLFWRRYYYLGRSWRQAAEELGLVYEGRGPSLAGHNRGRRVALQIRQASSPGDRAGGARWRLSTRLSMRLSGSAELAVTVRRRERKDRLFPVSGFEAIGDGDLDGGLGFQGDVELLRAALQARPALGRKLVALCRYPAWELSIRPDSLVYTGCNALVGREQVVTLFELVGDVADLLQVE